MESALLSAVVSARRNPTLALLSSAAVWQDGSDLSVLRQDRGGASATVAAAVGSPAGSWRSKANAGGWFTSSTDAKRFTSRAGYVEADGADDAMQGPTIAAPTGYTIGVVAQCTSTGSTRRIVSQGRNGSEPTGLGCYLRQAGGQWQFGTGDANLVSGGSSSALSVVVGIATLTTSTLRVNGVQVATTAAGSALDAPYGMTISGYANGGGEVWQGPIYGVVVFSTPLNSSDVSLLEQYLAKLGGVTW